MNILPHKSWHVRTKANINRVRRDEENARKAEKVEEERRKLAESEARINLLRRKACKGHLNFFQDLESGLTTKNVNPENESEKKQEQETWEKKMGILNYLGQDHQENELWWNKKKQEESTSKNEAYKDIIDPLNDIRRYLGTPGVKQTLKRKRSPSPSTSTSTHSKKTKSSSIDFKSKKKKKKKKSKRKSKKKSQSKKKKRKRDVSSSSSSSSSDDLSEPEEELKDKALKKLKLEKLRKQRLEREKYERIRETRLLNGQNPDIDPNSKEEEEKTRNNRQYNSQFNPDYAKQNKLDTKKKYWLE